MSDTPGGNMALVGKMCMLSGVVMLGVSLSAWMRWLPYNESTLDLFAKVFAVTGVMDLVLGFFFISRDRP